MTREVEPELLDELPPEDPRAMRSRRDLQRIHGWMGNVGTVARLLGGVIGSAKHPRIVDLGAGDGTFMLQVARRVARNAGEPRLLLVDRQPIVTSATRRGFAALAWDLEMVQADVFDWLADAPVADVAVACLFLHHFVDEKLARLLGAISKRTENFMACEPRRCRLALTAGKMVGLIGCNAVTRHDAVVSVRAGFVGRELSALWPGEERWRVEEREAGLFSHLFVAQRS